MSPGLDTRLSALLNGQTCLELSHFARFRGQRQSLRKIRRESLQTFAKCLRESN